jgi:hypothetical protein
VRYAYYQRLSAGDRKIYRKSDGITELALPDARALWPDVAELERALEQGKAADVRRAAARLSGAMAAQLGVSRVRVKVLGVRPSDRDGELHGLYTAEEGERPEIEVWMRTAAHRRVVAFRTFLRTLLHELCHHFDLTLLGLGETFHTEGFFRRESSLFRQLEPGAGRDAPPARSEPKARKPRAARAAAAPDRQLSLFKS